MTYSKYPKQIRHYHDLFEGDFFLPENQELFQQASDKLKKKIYTILSKEATMYQNMSDFSSRDILNKGIQRKNYISHSGGRQNPVSYLSRLDSYDRNNLNKLLFEVFYNKGDGLYRNGIDRVFAIGSSTYDQSYRDQLSQGPYKQDEQIQQRVDKRGNDIDIMIGSNHYISGHLYHGDRAIKNPNQHSTLVILNLIIALLRNYDIPHRIEEHRKDGTSHLGMTNIENDEITIINTEHIKYHSTNIIITFPNGRPIHIVADGEDITGAYKREFLEQREYVCLFDSFEEISLCKEIFKKIEEGEHIFLPQTLEERYAILQDHKRNTYKSKLESIKEKKEKNASEKEEFAKLTPQERHERLNKLFGLS